MLNHFSERPLSQTLRQDFFLCFPTPPTPIFSPSAQTFVGLGRGDLTLLRKQVPKAFLRHGGRFPASADYRCKDSERLLPTWARRSYWGAVPVMSCLLALGKIQPSRFLELLEHCCAQSSRTHGFHAWEF